MATDDDDAATLRERVRDLEATVAQQQDTIEQLMPSRRAILAGGVGLVGGAALTGQASAQSAAGQVGTSSEPVDVEAATVTADSVNTEGLTTNTPDGTAVVMNINPSLQVVTSDAVTIADGDKEVIQPQGFFFSSVAAMICVYSSASNKAALVSASGSSVTIKEQQDTAWTAADSDGNDCIFRDGNSDLVIKNRTGGSGSYQFTMMQAGNL